MASSWAIMPAAASMARRPLFSSLFCIWRSSAAFCGLRPSGSNPKSPASWSARIAHVSPPTGDSKVKTEKIWLGLGLGFGFGFELGFGLGSG